MPPRPWQRPDPDPDLRPGQTQAYRDYRTDDGTGTDYRFSFEKQRNGGWRVYIERQPGYGGRADDTITTHRLSDGRRKYVCWSRRIDTFEQAKGVARAWADATQRYIRDGTRF